MITAARNYFNVQDIWEYQHCIKIDMEKVQIYTLKELLLPQNDSTQDLPDSLPLEADQR